MKTCSKCGETKPSEEFHRDPQKKDGLHPNCKACRRLASAARYLARKGRILAQNEQYRKRNLDKILQKQRRYYKENPSIFAVKRKDHYKANKALYLSYNAKRRAAKLNQTPSWLTEEHLHQIKEIYKTCPEGYHVDHIVPLQGKKVRGLHVPWNLQHLPAKENLRKNNRHGQK